MDNEAIRAMLAELAQDVGDRDCRTTTRNAMLSARPDAEPHVDAIERWVNAHGRTQELPASTAEPGMRPDVTTERPGHHTPADVRYWIRTDALRTA